MRDETLIEKMRRLLLGERTIESIRVTQQFPLYGLMPETYVIDFIDNWFGTRSLKISASVYCGERKLWMGTELYVLTIVPWMSREISNEALKSHIDILKGLSDQAPFKKPEKEKTDGKKRNVIVFNKHFKKKKKRPDKF